MLNQYSFILIALAVIVAAGLLLLTNNPQIKDFLAFGAVAAALVAAWVTLHPVQTPLMSDSQKVQALIGKGKPVLLEFQSPY